MIEQRCKHHCCEIRFCPLIVAFGRTIHSFQGQQAGPGNPIESIICNPGERSFEAINPGTLLTCITRATTIGNFTQNNSAIYFTGSGFCQDRISKMSYRVNGCKYAKVILRETFTNYLQQQIKSTKSSYKKLMTSKKIKKIHDWYKTTRVSKNNFNEIIMYNNLHIK